MNINELERKIKEISQKEKIHEQEIINQTIAYLEQKYEPKDYSDSDKKIIKNIEGKMTSTHYSKKDPKQITTQAPAFYELFSLDTLEMKLMEAAWSKLLTDGDVFQLAFEIGLTEQGVRKYR